MIRSPCVWCESMFNWEKSVKTTITRQITWWGELLGQDGSYLVIHVWWQWSSVAVTTDQVWPGHTQTCLTYPWTQITLLHCSMKFLLILVLFTVSGILIWDLETFSLFKFLLAASAEDDDCEEFECVVKDGSFADPCTCRRYYQCVDFRPITSFCPSGLYWDDIKKFCTYKNEAVCGPVASTTPPPSTTPHPDTAEKCRQSGPTPETALWLVEIPYAIKTQLIFPIAVSLRL